MSDFYKALPAAFNGGEVVYEFLSRTFLAPVSDSYYAMLNDLLPLMEKMLESGNGKIRSGINGLKSFMSKRSSLTGNKLAEFDTNVLRDYTRLFCLGGLAVPVSESVYTSLSSIEMQESRDDMRRLFAESGIKLTCRYNEPEDHIGNEMHLMSAYYSLASEAVSAGDREKLALIGDKMLYLHRNHFASWIRAFSENVRGVRCLTGFYTDIIDFTEGFIEEDFAFLNEILPGSAGG